MEPAMDQVSTKYDAAPLWGVADAVLADSMEARWRARKVATGGTQSHVATVAEANVRTNIPMR